ncbi:MAG: CAAX protease [Elainellaceae cyanobacterium]
MTDTALARFWELVGWVFALNEQAFRVVATLPQGFWVAVIIVLIAGLSQAIAQGIILFVNQVKPLRFVLSLLVSAILFVAGFFFLVLSTWLITLLPWSVSLSFGVLATILGIAYAPLVFSFLGALPYLGVPILSLLSVWHLLAMVVGFSAVSELGLGLAFCYVAVGWIVLQILQNTVGQPIARLGSRIANAVAGVELATHRREMMEQVRDRPGDTAADRSSAWSEEFRQRITELRQRATQGLSEAAAETLDAVTSAAGVNSASSSPPSAPASGFIKGGRQGWQRTLQTILGLIGIAALTLVIVVVLRPVREWWFGWYDNLPGVLRFIFSLAWIGLVALVVAGLLAPLETLGWWAGWYDDEIDTTVNAGELATSVTSAGGQAATITRYVVYLDGIGKSTFEYLPDIEEFLATLAPALPDHVALIRGIMPYSVINNPLDEDRPLAFLWKAADKARFGNPAALLGLLVNIRNVLVVGVSADKRYGPLYNQGIAQVVFNGLIKNGYEIGSGTPITLVGYSGGGQMACACAPFLKRALSAPIDVISLGGVISGNCNVLKLEQLYHLVGDKDKVERIGPVMFPGRWPIFPLSYWNRAKRRGNISIFSMGPTAHQVPGGILDPDLMLPDGRSALQQTIDYIKAILRGDLLPEPVFSAITPSNYDRYRKAPFNRPEYYPLQSAIASDLYQPIAPWMGRLILPERDKRSQVNGALLEVHHAPADYRHLVGTVVALRWSHHPAVQRRVKAVTKDLHFSADAEYTSVYEGLVHPDRLNHWQQVDPLESLAGSHPVNDIMVMLPGPVEVEPQTGMAADDTHADALYVASEPVQITGRHYGLVQFVHAIGGDRYQVVHFNRHSRQFDGPRAVVAMPPVVADQNNCFNSSRQDIEKSPLNEMGWYIYGAADAAGRFVVQALAPRSLLTLQPDRVIFGRKAAYQHIRQETWADLEAKKGHIASVLCTARDNGTPAAIQGAVDEWPEGTRALVLHVYGGIGGNKREPAAQAPIFFGHFAYGVATVVREPLTEDLRFDICYHQVYTHNPDGLVAGTLHWSRYMGDRQFGWVGVRPVCDLLVKLDSFTGWYEMDGERRSPLSSMVNQLTAMTARYRIGDGTGGTYVGPANNCSQDSNQALFATLDRMESAIQANADWLLQWMAHQPHQATRLRQAVQLGADLQQVLQPFGSPRADWEQNEYNLGSTLEDEPIRNLIMGLGSWRTLLPRKASDTVVKVFLDYGASVWVLRTNQIGGLDPDIEPIAPMTL